MHENPYQSPIADTTPVVGVLSGERADLRRVAIYQKGLIYSIAVIALLHAVLVIVPFLQTSPPNLLLALVTVATSLILLVSLIVGTAFVFLLSLKVYRVIWGIVMGLCSLVPCLGLLALLTVNQKATDVLRANGIKVGLFGARLSDLPVN